MEQGFASIITAASTLLGLVLVVLVFALSSASSLLGSMGHSGSGLESWISPDFESAFLQFTIQDL